MLQPRSPGWSLPVRARAALIALVRRNIWGNEIGRGTHIHPSAYIDRTWPRGIHIGRDCLIHDEAVVLTHDLTRGIYLDTRIGDRTVIGQRAIVLPGVTIGEDCIVMPGALVLRDVPPGHVATGNPAACRPREA